MKIFIFVSFSFLIFSCTDKSKNATTDQPSVEQLFSRGQAVYNLNCIACHNADPTQDGIAGPAIKGSSKELLAARVLKASYPADYKPKRETKQMPALPHLEKEISAIEAFLR